MGSYALTRSADNDVQNIAEHSVKQWGLARAESGSHSIFYQRSEAGVLIVRVLHQRMDFERHLQ